MDTELSIATQDTTALSPRETRDIETTSNALAAQARAQIEAGYVMAIRRPRDELDARSRLLRACRRPLFASSAEYSRPVGGGKTAKGPTIRFAEACQRAMGNIKTGARIIHEDESQRIFNVFAIDLETNNVNDRDILVKKTVESRSLAQGARMVSQRQNASGEVVYVIEANEHRLRAKQDAEISKALRQCIMRLIPEDIVAEGMEMCRKTLRSEAKDNPEAYRKRIVDGFDSLGVPPSALVEYLGHPVERSSPAEIESLRLLYGAIKEGETTFDGALQLHRRPDEPDVSPKSAKAKARAILTAAKPSPPDAA